MLMFYIFADLTVLGSLQIDRVDGESLKTILNKNPFKYNETIDNLTVEVRLR